MLQNQQILNIFAIKNIKKMTDRIKASEINKLAPMEIFENEKIKNRIVTLVNRTTRDEQGEKLYYREQQHFMSLLAENEDLRKCTPLSLYKAFMDVALLGLSVAKVKDPLAYLIPYNVKTGNGGWEKRVSLEVSPYGELAMRKFSGQIKDVDNPVIVYEEDDFSDEYKDGNRIVNYKRNPHKPNSRIVAGFMRIVKNDGSVDFFVMDMDEVNRLAGYSEKKNKGKTNELYTKNDGQIDTGFFKAKIIKHAFKGYPKAPLMQHVTNTVLQTEKDDDIKKLMDVEDDAPHEPENKVEDVTHEVVETENYEKPENNESY